MTTQQQRELLWNSVSNLLIANEAIDNSYWVTKYGGSTKDRNAFNGWDELDAYLSKIKTYEFDTVFKSGRHKAKTVRQVLSEHPDYLSWCIRSLDYVFLSRNVIKELIDSGHEFFYPTINCYKDKRMHYLVAIYLRRYVRKPVKRIDDFEDEPEESMWESRRNSSSFYNDSLDMDQQSQEYWYNL